MDTIKTKEKYYSIISGPSRDVLFDACKYLYDKNARFTVDFTVVVGRTMLANDSAYIPMAITDMKICGIEHEDASGFNLHGCCKADLKYTGGSDIYYKLYKFKAYYNTEQREGFICFSDPG